MPTPAGDGRVTAAAQDPADRPDAPSAGRVAPVAPPPAPAPPPPPDRAPTAAVARDAPGTGGPSDAHGSSGTRAATLSGVLRRAAGAVGLAILVASATALAFGVGIATARRATDAPSPFGRIALGPWVANPTLGLADADPYTRAALARSGAVPLGQAEGIVFTAGADSAGRPLDAACRYRIAGRMPTARRWSLVPVPRLDAADRPGVLHSAALLRERGGGFEIVLGHGVEPGNWLALPPAGPFSLRAALYDTPVTREADLGSVSMPDIERLDCPGRPERTAAASTVGSPVGSPIRSPVRSSVGSSVESSIGSSVAPTGPRTETAR